MLIASIIDFTNWKDAFIKYIESNGNKPSVAKDYARRVEKILKENNITIQTLYCEIDQWIDEYKTGRNASINKARHYAASSALIKFKAFALTLSKPYIPDPPDFMDVLAGNNTDIIY